MKMSLKSKRPARVLPLLIAVAGLLDASARKIEDWSYERLFETSDLVVIARPLESKGSADRAKDNPWGIEFVGVETTFEGLHVLKGESGDSGLTVLHYRTDARMEDGPGLVTFRTKGARYTIVETDAETDEAVRKVVMESPPTYLLFLRKRDDGRFEPVSGQVDPSFSVRELRMPMSDD